MIIKSLLERNCCLQWMIIQITSSKLEESNKQVALE